MKLPLIMMKSSSKNSDKWFRLLLIIALKDLNCLLHVVSRLYIYRINIISGQCKIGKKQKQVMMVATIISMHFNYTYFSV